MFLSIRINRAVLLSCSLQADRSRGITCGGRTAPHPHHRSNCHLLQVRLISQPSAASAAISNEAIAMFTKL